jgi:hypothetical protein
LKCVGKNVDWHFFFDVVFICVNEREVKDIDTCVVFRKVVFLDLVHLLMISKILFR